MNNALLIFASACGVVTLNAGAFTGAVWAHVATALLLAPLAWIAFRGLAAD